MSIAIDLKGAVAWVTGGGSGIGAAVAATLAAAGARVVSLDRTYAAEGSHGPIRQIPLDVRDTAAVTDVAARMFTEGLVPDVLVNAAGGARDSVVWKMSDEQWNEVVDVNLTGAFRMTRACAAAMRGKGAGTIVNIASINAMRGKVGQSNYAASKGGLIGFTKAVAAELARDGIRVNAVAPGFIETPLTIGLPPEILDEARAEIILGHQLGQPQDVANAVLFLASPLASHITGEVLVVDGGQLL